MTAGALLLAAALLIAPASPRRRLAPPQASPARRRTTVGVVAATATAVLAFVVPPAVVLAGVVVAATVTWRSRRSAMARRRAEEAAALQGGLDVLIGELRAGAHPVAAFDVAAHEVTGPVAVALRGVAARARLGADVSAGLLAVARVSSLPAHWERLSVCWSLAQTRGLAIVTLMRTAQRDIVERERFASHVAAGMAGARTTAAVLAGLPLLGIGLGELIGADPVRFLVSDELGGWLLVLGAALACGGLVWSDCIVGGALE